MEFNKHKPHYVIYQDMQVYVHGFTGQLCYFDNTGIFIKVPLIDGIESVNNNLIWRE